MNVLFVHGMARSSLVWLPTIAWFKAQGIALMNFRGKRYTSINCELRFYSCVTCNMTDIREENRCVQ